MLKQRFITGIVLAPLVMAAILLLPAMGFILFIGGVLALGAWEWGRMSGLKTLTEQCVFSVFITSIYLAIHWMISDPVKPWVLGVGLLGWLPALCLVLGYPKSHKYWQHSVTKLLMGAWVLLNFGLSMSILEDMQLHNTHQTAFLGTRGVVILSILLIIWSADTGAYFTGKSIGKHKLAPQVSPGKTWEGVAGGVVAACIASVGVSLAWSERLSIHETPMTAVLITVAFITLMSVLGDLFESMFKRQSGFKDSSQLLPGHGGVMDRIDSLTAAAPLFVFCLWLSGAGI